MAAIAVWVVPAGAADCDALRGMALAGAAITSAQVAAPGSHPFGDLPAFCRVAATLRPSADSDIRMEVWLPISGWNGKYQAVGNGGWAGSISYPAMGQALRRGYATSSTDTGHAGAGASFALGHPEKLIDYAWRSEHEVAVKAKAIVAAFYGHAPKLSYWNGCSAGGKQALKEAQRFPGDFDGIIAGAPGNNWTGRAEGAIWVAQAAHRNAASYIPPEKYAVIHRAVLEACDALDGVRDGVLEDPRRCHFDPQVLECQGAGGADCLTAAQVETARRIYSGAINPRTGQQIYPGLEPGSEMGWGVLAGPQPFAIANEHFKYVVFRNPGWDYRTLDFDRDIALTEKLDNGLINATDPNLRAFFARGGKLIQYHGWNDWQIAPRNSVNYYQSALEEMGAASRVPESYRLFMAPGMGHCGGSDGPNTFDMLGALEQWVEKGEAPAQITASRLRDGKVDRTRPLCPYPQIARYKGGGSTDEARNFVCASP